MKIKNGFVLRDISGQAVVVATGEASETFHGMIKLNDTARYIWELMEKETDFDFIVASVTEKYNIDTDKACADVREFVDNMEKEGFLEQ